MPREQEIKVAVRVDVEESDAPPAVGRLVDSEQKSGSSESS